MLLRLLENEKRQVPSQPFLCCFQKDITPSMRSTLAGWLFDVCDEQRRAEPVCACDEPLGQVSQRAPCIEEQSAGPGTGSRLLADSVFVRSRGIQGTKFLYTGNLQNRLNTAIFFKSLLICINLLKKFPSCVFCR